MKTKCKFKCNTVLNGEHFQEITLTPVVYDTEENKTFWKYTPSGSFTLSLSDEYEGEKFIPGKEYYITIQDA